MRKGPGIADEVFLSIQQEHIAIEQGQLPLRNPPLGAEPSVQPDDRRLGHVERDGQGMAPLEL